jgi:hypothetical protein
MGTLQFDLDLDAPLIYNDQFPLDVIPDRVKVQQGRTGSPLQKER